MMQESIYGEIPHSLGGTEISADIIWRKNIKRGKSKIKRKKRKKEVKGKKVK